MGSTKPEVLGDPRRLLPLVAAGFAELGYRRATTARLARRCGVRENVLYRVWPNKKAMFLASIDYVFDSSLARWREVMARLDGSGSGAERVLDFESTHHGEHGLYRIVFAGLTETDDPDVRQTLKRMYLRFHAFIFDRIVAESAAGSAQHADMLAWAFVGLGTVSNIGRELRLFTSAQRTQLFQTIGRQLLGSDRPQPDPGANGGAEPV